MRGVATNVAVRPRRSDNNADGRAPPEPLGRRAAAVDFCVAPPRRRANSSLRRRVLNSPRRRHARTSPYLWSGVLSSSDWPRVQELFEAAHVLPDGDRAAFLERE